jgi:bile acid:Na+ symporter, BASS family
VPVFESIAPETAQAMLVRVAVVTLMVSLGLRVPFAAIAASLRQGRAIVTTLALALIAVPALAWLMVNALEVPEHVAVGIMLVAAAPAGSLSLKLVDLADGDVALALGLFFVLALIAPVSMPLTASIVLGLSATTSGVDVATLLTTLLLVQTLPMALALAFAHLAPRRARALGVRATQLATLLLVALIAFAIVVNWDEVVAVGARGLVAIVTIVAITLVGSLLIWGGRQRIGRAVAFLSAQRSVSLALLVATTIGVPAITGAVVACGLILLLINPLIARLLALAVPVDRREPAPREAGQAA